MSQSSTARADQIAFVVLVISAACFLAGGTLFVGVGLAPSVHWSTLELLSWALMIVGAIGSAGSIVFMCTHEAPQPLEFESTILPFMQSKGRRLE